MYNQPLLLRPWPAINYCGQNEHCPYLKISKGLDKAEFYPT